jgi:hypothetical protein
VQATIRDIEDESPVSHRVEPHDAVCTTDLPRVTFECRMRARPPRAYLSRLTAIPLELRGASHEVDRVREHVMSRDDGAGTRRIGEKQKYVGARVDQPADRTTVDAIELAVGAPEPHRAGATQVPRVLDRVTQMLGRGARVEQDRCASAVLRHVDERTDG